MSRHYMLRRNKMYYFRQRIPKDLEHLFPVETIARSLKTRDLKIAKLLMHSIQGKLETTFALLRTGFLDEDILLRLLGDREISAYSREECVTCRDTLMKLPPNFNKRGKYIDQSHGAQIANKHYLADRGGFLLLTNESSSIS